MGRAAILALILAILNLPAPADSRPTQDKEKVRKALDYSRRIDTALKKKESAMPAGDAEFLRRVTLDLTGAIPTTKETRAFVADQNETKRQDVIEKLLASEAFNDHWARFWSFVLFGNYYDIRASVGGKNVQGNVIRKAFGDFRKWMAEQIAKDAPWQAIVAELIQSTGKLSTNPILLYKTAFYYEGDAALNLADGMSKSLLGMRISCARCHDHPFDRWTQEDYYGLAAFLVRVRAMPAPSNGKMGDNNQTDDVEFSEEGKNELTMPETSKMMRPKFLFGGQAGTTETRLPWLAKFMVMKENSQLPRNVVNRIWAWLMGRGFVEPVDDFNAQNKPIYSAVMEDLVKGFVANGSTIRFLFRAICNSEAYQRASAGGTQSDPYASAAIRQLTGEQLFKSLATACSNGEAAIDFNARPMQNQWNAFRDQLRPLYGADNNWTEVTPLPGNTRQALLLRNGGWVDQVLKNGGLLAKVRGMQGPARLEEIFLAILCRAPEEYEVQRYANADAEDVVWTLINSAEFITRH